MESPLAPMPRAIQPTLIGKTISFKDLKDEAAAPSGGDPRSEETSLSKIMKDFGSPMEPPESVSVRNINQIPN